MRPHVSTANISRPEVAACSDAGSSLKPLHQKITDLPLGTTRSFTLPTFISFSSTRPVFSFSSIMATSKALFVMFSQAEDIPITRSISARMTRTGPATAKVDTLMFIKAMYQWLSQKRRRRPKSTKRNHQKASWKLFKIKTTSSV